MATAIVKLFRTRICSSVCGLAGTVYDRTVFKPRQPINTKESPILPLASTEKSGPVTFAMLFTLPHFYFHSTTTAQTSYGLKLVVLQHVHAIPSFQIRAKRSMPA